MRVCCCEEDEERMRMRNDEGNGKRKTNGDSVRNEFYRTVSSCGTHPQSRRFLLVHFYIIIFFF